MQQLPLWKNRPKNMDKTGKLENNQTVPVQGTGKAPLPRGRKIAKLRFRRSCAWIVGLVYFISGILKLIDPTGSGLVVEEYFHFLHLGFLLPFAKASGTAFAFLEVTLGAALLTGVWRKIIAPDCPPAPFRAGTKCGQDRYG